MTTALFILGVASVCAGVALIFPPAAFIVAGGAVAALAVALELAPAPEAPDSPDGDS